MELCHDGSETLNFWRKSANGIEAQVQPCSLSSSKRECIDISELVKEVSFVKQTVEDFGHKVEVLILIHCDNQGTVDVVKTMPVELEQGT